MKLIENETTEFKRDYVDEIKKTIIAFANTNGGILYIGINDDGSVTGVMDTDEIILKASNAIRDAIKPDVTLFVKTEQVVMADKNVIKITVQKGTACPYYLSGKGIRPEGVYVRHGASSVPATETAIIKMIKETDGDRFETARSLNQELTFIEAAKEFDKRGVPFGENQYKTLKMMTTDGIFTNLGMLLSDQCSHTIKLAVFQGTDKSMFKDRRELTGSLLKQLNDAYDFIDLHNGTRAEIVGLYRSDKRNFPPEAVREALLNALVHRDYGYRAGTLISIFDDHLEFISVGGLVRGITFEDMMLGISMTRNENLANVFYRLALIEAYGTGVPKILKAYEGEPVQPKIEATENAFKITLPNRNANSGTQKLADIEASILDLFQMQPELTRREVETALALSQTATGRYLKKLVSNGLLETMGKGKNTRYGLRKK